MFLQRYIVQRADAAARSRDERLAEPRTSLLDEPHHDGSELVRARAAGRARRRGDRAPARAARGGAPTRSLLRYVRDGEPRAVRGGARRRDRGRDLVARELPGREPGDALPLAALGRRRRLRLAERPRRLDARRAGRRRLRARRRAARRRTGTSRSVVYEIFPDRFASSGAERRAAGVGRPRASGTSCRPAAAATRRTSGSAATCRASSSTSTTSSALGANVIYLTPIFPAGSTHRYDATTFDRVDPLLGGDEALASLARPRTRAGCACRRPDAEPRAATAHEWFERARRRRDAPERELFYFDDALPHGYEAWAGRAARCRSSTGARPSCAAGWPRPSRRWLDAPYALDGWRIDVANMVGPLPRRST